MLKERKTLKFFLISALIVYLAVGYPWFYIARDISGKVIDRDTAEPVPNAIVVAQWISYVDLQGNHSYVLKVREDVTDEHGNFLIEGWGPKFRMPFTGLDRFDPIISVLKDGYSPESFANRGSNSNIVRNSEFNGRAIKLKKFGGTDREYAGKLGALSTRFDFTGSNWRTYTTVLRELDRLKAAYRSKGVDELRLSGIFSFDKLDDAKEANEVRDE